MFAPLHGTAEDSIENDDGVDHIFFPQQQLRQPQQQHGASLLPPMQAGRQPVQHLQQQLPYQQQHYPNAAAAPPPPPPPSHFHSPHHMQQQHYAAAGAPSPSSEWDQHNDMLLARASTSPVSRPSAGLPVRASGVEGHQHQHQHHAAPPPHHAPPAPARKRVSFGPVTIVSITPRCTPETFSSSMDPNSQSLFDSQQQQYGYAETQQQQHDVVSHPQQQQEHSAVPLNSSSGIVASNCVPSLLGPLGTTAAPVVSPLTTVSPVDVAGQAQQHQAPHQHHHQHAAEGDQHQYVADDGGGDNAVLQAPSPEVSTNTASNLLAVAELGNSGFAGPTEVSAAAKFLNFLHDVDAIDEEASLPHIGGALPPADAFGRVAALVPPAWGLHAPSGQSATEGESAAAIAVAADTVQTDHAGGRIGNPQPLLGGIPPPPPPPLESIQEVVPPSFASAAGGVAVPSAAAEPTIGGLVTESVPTPQQHEASFAQFEVYGLAAMGLDSGGGGGAADNGGGKRSSEGTAGDGSGGSAKKKRRAEKSSTPSPALNPAVRGGGGAKGPKPVIPAEHSIKSNPWTLSKRYDTSQRDELVSVATAVAGAPGGGGVAATSSSRAHQSCHSQQRASWLDDDEDEGVGAGDGTADVAIPQPPRTVPVAVKAERGEEVGKTTAEAATVPPQHVAQPDTTKVELPLSEAAPSAGATGVTNVGRSPPQSASASAGASVGGGLALRCDLCRMAEVPDARGTIVCRRGPGQAGPDPINAALLGGGLYAVHVSCALWAPEVYFDPAVAEADGQWVGLLDAIARGGQIKCAHCRVLGATIGCASGSCQRSFHYHCACDAAASRVVMDHGGIQLRCHRHAGVWRGEPSSTSGKSAPKSPADGAQ